jgi:tRNA pseudouridine32 synthase/23S rRNA pseudouridine746 synthase
MRIARMKILHLDERLIVLDKPSGLLAVPGRGPELRDSLTVRVQEQYPEALVVHRLDRDTSGVMVMARDIEAQRLLSRQFHDRLVEKKYVAVVYGDPHDEAGRIELAMRKDFDRPPRHMIDSVEGRPAITDWRVLDRQGNHTRLELRPLTGRSHQLRLHLAHLGHPVLGDPLYAHETARLLADRLLLHAHTLTLAHPATGEPATWTEACSF